MINATLGAKIRGTRFSQFGHDFAIPPRYRLYIRRFFVACFPCSLSPNDAVRISRIVLEFP